MSEIKIVKKVVRVHVGDKHYDVSKPTMRQAQKYAKSKTIEETVDFLDELGLPKDICWDLDVDSLREITESLMPQKKS